MRIRWATASKSAKSGETGYAPALAVLPTKPERQRGLWSFLTWSFFLSQVMAGKSFFPDGAHAAQDDYDGVSAHATSDANSTFDDMPRAASGIAALAEIQEDQAAASQHNNHLARS